jgi:hypothetical protein
VSLVSARRLAVVTMLQQVPRPPRIVLSGRTRRLLWIVAVLDMMDVAWMITLGDWLDRTSRITGLVTLGGHHMLVLIMALAAFLGLAGLALPTSSFESTSKLQLMLIIVACVASVVALVGALSAILALAAAGGLAGFLGRLLFRR